MKMEIKILGTGCARCNSLEKAVINALAELDIAADVEKVEDIQRIMEYGILHTPGLVINEKVVLSGRIPNMEELKNIINQNR